MGSVHRDRTLRGGAGRPRFAPASRVHPARRAGAKVRSRANRSCSGFGFTRCLPRFSGCWRAAWIQDKREDEAKDRRGHSGGRGVDQRMPGRHGLRATAGPQFRHQGFLRAFSVALPAAAGVERAHGATRSRPDCRRVSQSPAGKSPPHLCRSDLPRAKAGGRPDGASRHAPARLDGHPGRGSGHGSPDVRNSQRDCPATGRGHGNVAGWRRSRTGTRALLVRGRRSAIHLSGSGGPRRLPALCRCVRPRPRGGDPCLRCHHALFRAGDRRVRCAGSGGRGVRDRRRRSAARARR